MSVLVTLSYSPWSEKARWALDHHRVDYREVHHVPLLGEPMLRLRARRLRGRVSVPLYVHAGGIIPGSLAIARHVDAHGAGDSLFAAGTDGEIDAWDLRIDGAIGAARVLVISRLRESRAAQSEALPGFIPRAMREAMAPMAQMGAAYLVRKYHVGIDTEDARARMRDVLGDVRRALSGKKYLLGDFSFADVAAAALIQGVVPVDDRHLSIGPATRGTWTDEALASEFADLVDWRDELYESRRRPG